jgi:CheY-like chemotaxis protein
LLEAESVGSNGAGVNGRQATHVHHRASRVRKRVLVVDDGADERQIACTILEHAGYEVAGVDSASRAFELLAPFHPDLIVMDLMMPDIDGLTAIDLLRASPGGGEIPVLLHTAYEDVFRDRLHRRKLFNVLPKPSPPAQLVAAVRHLIGPPTPSPDVGDRTREEMSATDSRAVDRRALGPSTVLLVVQDDDLRTLLGLHLKHEGFRVHTAATLEEGHPPVRRSSDVLALEVSAGDDPTELLQAIRGKEGMTATRLVAMGDASLRSTLRRTGGFDAVLDTPVAPAGLIEEIRRVTRLGD